MSGVRIKDLQKADPLTDKFDDFEFVADVPEPDSTVRISGKKLKETIGLQRHTHPIEEVNGLPGELEKKLDKTGGTMTGDLRVEGNARMRNLRIDEYLEVPELKYNRITATGNEFWVTDAGIVDDVEVFDEGICVITLKEKTGEHTINFQYKDILRGIFYTEDENGTATGFRTAYYEVTGIVDETRFSVLPLNDIIPERFMTLARQGNKSDPHRQGSIYLDGLNKQIKVNDGVTGKDIGVENIRVQLGDLSDIHNHPVFGQLQGYGALLENAYICGRLVQRDPVSGEEWIVGAVSVSGEQVFHYDEQGNPTPEEIVLTAKEQGFTSAPDLRKWQYKNGTDWITLPTQFVLTYTLRHDAEIWGLKRTLTLRYIVADVYYDIITIAKVHDGEDAVLVTVTSTNGNQFIGGNVATTLQATVYRGFTDITEDLPANFFDWIRHSDNLEGDAVWNSLHEAAGNEIEISHEDVYRRAVFTCEVNIP